MRKNLLRKSATVLLSALPLLHAACGVEPATEEKSADVGLVELALDVVPEGVVCVRVSANGPYRNKIALMATVPGVAFTQTVAGLPLGRVTFMGEAFAAACDGVTARTVPGWVTDTVEASVIEGTKGRVDLHMQRNGRADIAIDFSDEPACSGVGIACKSKTECCSGTCTTGVCTGAAVPSLMQ